MNKRYALAVLAILLTSTIHAQNFLQQLRGSITDDQTAAPVKGCTIAVSGTADARTETDSIGQYRLDLPPGTYNVTLLCPGYGVIFMKDVWVHSTRQQILDVQMKKLATSLDTVVVAGTPTDEVPIGAEVTQRTPAAFFDPARTATSDAGAMNADDQANNISVYGSSPAFLQWKLEGVEIVNPNHLENAGAINDRASVNGGGVSMLSAQVLGSSKFLYAPFGAANNNVLSGLFDIRFRNGNNEKSERTAQIGLLGTDLCAEGPFRKGGKSSYLINYRYSTLGLLSLIGVNFGNEKVNYQDMSYALVFPTKVGQFKLFGVGGLSTDFFKGARGTAKIESEKDLMDISYQSKSGITGGSWMLPVGRAAFLKATVAYSVKQVVREATPVAVSPLSTHSYDLLLQQKISGALFFSGRTKFAVIKPGVQFTQSNVALTQDSVQTIVAATLVQPYFALEEIHFSKFTLQAGIKGFVQPSINYFKPMPYGQLQWQLTTSQHVTLAYGGSAQIQPPLLYSGFSKNASLQPAVCQAATLAYQLQLHSTLLSVRVFDMMYSGLAVNDSSGFTSFNYFNENVPLPLTNSGTAVSQGVQLGIQQVIYKWRFQLSTAFFDAHAQVGNREVNGRYNSRYNTVLIAGREFRVSHKRTFGLYLKTTYRDGFYESQSSDPFLYSQQLPAYFRMDGRFSLKTERARISTLLALDIQNLSNQQNVSYHYFDNVVGNMVTKYQNGLIPVLSYRIFF